MSISQHEQHAQELRNRDLQVTPQRLALLAAVEAHPHTRADELVEHIRANLGSVSRQAVYDALKLLTEKHLIRRIQPAGRTACYERAQEHHHHLVCRYCDVILDTESISEHPSSLHSIDAKGFVIEAAEIIYWGVCPDCQHLDT